MHAIGPNTASKGTNELSLIHILEPGSLGTRLNDCELCLLIVNKCMHLTSPQERSECLAVRCIQCVIFSGFSVGSCINEEKDYLLPT